MTTTRSTSGRDSSTRCSTRTSVAPSRSTTRPRTDAHLGRAVGVEVGRRLVEHEQAGLQRERPGQGEALLLAAGQGVRRTLAPVREVHRGERGVDARPDALRRDASVLEPEGDVVAGPPHHDLRLGILEEQSGAVACRARLEAVDEQRPLHLATAPRIDRGPASAASSVDFPAPDGPSSSTRSPGSIVRSRPRSAQSRRPGCRTPQPRASIRAGRATSRIGALWAVGASDLALFAPHREVAQDAGGDERTDQQPCADAGDERRR